MRGKHSYLGSARKLKISGYRLHIFRHPDMRQFAAIIGDAQTQSWRMSLPILFPADAAIDKGVHDSVILEVELPVTAPMRRRSDNFKRH